jgi:hypothetical protein
MILIVKKESVEVKMNKTVDALDARIVVKAI